MPGLRPLLRTILCIVAVAAGCARRPDFEIEEIAGIDTAGWAHDVALDGDSLYVSDRQAGFVVLLRPWDSNRQTVRRPVDDVISLAPNHGEPVLAARFEGLVSLSGDGGVLSRCSNGDIANAVATRHDLAFAAYGLHGLVIVSLAPGGMRVLAELPTPGWSHDIKLSGAQALLADWQYGLRVVDIHDPAHPREIAALSSPATTISVSIRETGGKRIAALADGHAGVAIAELEDSGQPRLLGRNTLDLNPADRPHPESGGWVHGVAWSSRHIFAANWKRGLAVLDAANLHRPRLELELPTKGTALGVKSELQPDGSWLIFLADGEAGVKIFRFRE